MKNYSLIAVLLLTAGCNGNPARSNNTTSTQQGVIVITSLNVKNDSAYKKFKDYISAPLDKHHGKIVRDFNVMGEANGSINFGPVNRLFVIKFPNNQDNNLFFRDSTVKKQLKKLNSNNLKIISGGMLSPLSDRNGELFVLKISNYKSNDGKAQKIADKINLELKQNYGFHLDIAIRSTSTKNIKRADEVAIFLYTKAASQKALYKNGRIMQQIGDFNMKYLNDFVYLALKPLEN